MIENQCNLKGNKICKSLYKKKLKIFKKPFLLLLTCAFDSNLLNQGRKERRNFGFLFLKREYLGHREQTKKKPNFEKLTLKYFLRTGDVKAFKLPWTLFYRTLHRRRKNNPPNRAVCLGTLTIYLIFVSLSGILETWKDGVGGGFLTASVWPLSY